MIEGAEAIVGADPTNERAWWLLIARARRIRPAGGRARRVRAGTSHSRRRARHRAELAAAPGGAGRAPPARRTAPGGRHTATGDVPSGNIPFEVDTFIGRAKELGDIAAALRRPPPGHARRCRGRRQDPSCPPGREPGRRTSCARRLGGGAGTRAIARTTSSATVAAALRADEHPGDDPTDSVVHWLHDREVLLVLDNCEHVLDAVVAFVARLLGSCPTTRSPGDESRAVARPRRGRRRRRAAVAPARRRPGTTSADDSDAVGLFLDRARAADPAFVADDATVSLVAAACHRLDGLPLALEIAAAQLRWLSLADLVERLDGRFALVATGRRDADERQRTLEGVVAWSYATLSSAEQALFRRVACLPHSFTLDAVEMIGRGDPVPAGAEHQVLSRLVDKSLVMALAPDAGSRRYRLLDTLRQYAADRRAELDESDEADERLLAWGRAFVADIETAIRTPGQDRAMAVAALERVNLGGVLDVAVRRGALVDALRIVSAVPIGPNASVIGCWTTSSVGRRRHQHSCAPGHGRHAPSSPSTVTTWRRPSSARRSARPPPRRRPIPSRWPGRGST